MNFCVFCEYEWWATSDAGLACMFACMRWISVCFVSTNDELLLMQVLRVCLWVQMIKYFYDAVTGLFGAGLHASLMDAVDSNPLYEVHFTGASKSKIHVVWSPFYRCVQIENSRCKMSPQHLEWNAFRGDSGPLDWCYPQRKCGLQLDTVETHPLLEVHFHSMWVLCALAY